MQSDKALDADDVHDETFFKNEATSQYNDIEGHEEKYKDCKKKEKTLEEVVGEIVGKPTIWSVILVVSTMSYGLSVDSLTYDTVFAGLLPYEKWECISKKCVRLLDNFTDKAHFYSQATLCKSDLKIREDYIFADDNRTSFAVEWGLFCEGEAQMSFLSSSIFLGAYVGYLLASPAFDSLGRKKVTIASAILSFVSVLASGFCSNYYLMASLRFLCGLGKNVCWMGLYCWVLEFTPENMTTFMTVLSHVTHGLGFLLLDLLSYYIKDWRQIFFVVSAITALGTAPMFLIPESPRFLLTKGKLAEAKASLEVLSRFIGNPKSMEDVDLVYTTHKQDLLMQVKDFYVYPKLGRQTVLLALIWFMTCALHYTFNFGWGKISNDLYMSYVYGGLVTTAAYLILPVNKLLGKKRCMVFFLSSSCIFYLLAMIDYNISSNFTLEHLVSLLGYMTILGSYTLVYQYTGELTPTSHRGMVYCICASFSRIGSFLGPYIQLLFTVLDKKITFGLFAGGSLVCTVIVSFMRDPTGKAMPETPKEL
ncbi:hypothetical protein ACHWQZ_G014598 [Mnemiopsis leidyi]